MSNRFTWMPGWPTMQPTPIGEPAAGLPVIFLYCTGQVGYGKAFHGTARAEDGTILHRTSRPSRAIAFLKVDLLDHKKFATHYASGYQTQWVDDPDDHEGLQKAFRRTLVLKPEGQH